MSVRLKFLREVLLEYNGQEPRGFSVVSHLDFGFIVELLFPWM